MREANWEGGGMMHWRGSAPKAPSDEEAVTADAVTEGEKCTIAEFSPPVKTDSKSRF